MLSFTLGHQFEKSSSTCTACWWKLKKNLEEATEEERAYLNKCALISNVGATTRIENAVLTDVEIEWVDTVLSKDGKATAFEKRKNLFLISSQNIDNEV